MTGAEQSASSRGQTLSLRQQHSLRWRLITLYHFHFGSSSTLSKIPWTYELLIHRSDNPHSTLSKALTSQPKQRSGGFMIQGLTGLSMCPILTRKRLVPQNHLHLEPQQLQSLTQESHKIGATDSAILEGGEGAHPCL